ncbi:MAG: isoprenylcysteine carboxylmethyltransferase family protein [Candidatus Aminicenantales bacterium]
MAEKSFIRSIYRWRVRSATLLLLLIIILARPNLLSILAGLALSIIGLLIRMWASGHIRKEKELAVSGPYRYTRNPLYIGNFILGMSIAVGTYSLWCFWLFAAYFLVFYPPVIRVEKERMKRFFPKKYEEYKRSTPLFFPSLKPVPRSSGIQFSWALYKKNKEYMALIGATFFWIILIAKMFLFP